jgi:hypothetical protein
VKRIPTLLLTFLPLTLLGPSQNLPQDNERLAACAQWDETKLPPAGRADRAHPLRTAEPKLEKYEIVEHLAKAGTGQGGDYAFDYNGWKSPN